LSTLWTQARERGASLVDLARWTSQAPARFAGLSRRKGQISQGHDADFVVWDPDARFEVQAEKLFFKHRISPYLGQELFGAVRHTYLRGVEIFDGQQQIHPTGALGQALIGRDDAS
jgi:allantoinase